MWPEVSIKKSGITFVESGRASIRAGSGPGVSDQVCTPPGVDQPKLKSKERVGTAERASPDVPHVPNCPNDEGSWAAKKVSGVSSVAVHNCDHRSGARKSESRPVPDAVGRNGS